MEFKKPGTRKDAAVGCSLRGVVGEEEKMTEGVRFNCEV